MFLVPTFGSNAKIYTVFDNDQYRQQLGKLVQAQCAKDSGPLTINIGEESLVLGADECEDFCIEYAVLSIYMDLGLEPMNIM